MDDGKENGEVKVFCTGGEKIHNLVIEGARNFATDHWRAGCGARCTSHLCSLLIDPGRLVSWAHVMLNLQSFAEANDERPTELHCDFNKGRIRTDLKGAP